MLWAICMPRACVAFNLETHFESLILYFMFGPFRFFFFCFVLGIWGFSGLSLIGFVANSEVCWRCLVKHRTNLLISDA